jgi:hypothetical protein
LKSVSKASNTKALFFSSIVCVTSFSFGARSKHGLAVDPSVFRSNEESVQHRHVGE